jgi:hypothetical protein
VPAGGICVGEVCQFPVSGYQFKGRPGGAELRDPLNWELTTGN